MAGPARRREELEGLLEGIRHRLRQRPQPPPAGLATRLDEGEQALGAGDLLTAERALVEVDERLDQEEEEVELTEIPRGLVDYEPIGSRGAPVSREEDSVANRILLVQRLLDIRRAQGYEVAGLVAQLGRADEAYSAGDRIEARRLCDEVHSQLDEMGRRRPDIEPMDS